MASYILVGEPGLQRLRWHTDTERAAPVPPLPHRFRHAYRSLWLRWGQHPNPSALDSAASSHDQRQRRARALQFYLRHETRLCIFRCSTTRASTSTFFRHNNWSWLLTKTSTTHTIVDNRLPIFSALSC
jgi:hypothetical protein